MTTTMTRLPKLSFDPTSGGVFDSSSGIASPYETINHGYSVDEHIGCLKRIDNIRQGEPHFFHQPWEKIRKLYRDLGDMDAVREINWAYDQAKARFDYETAKGLKKPLIGVRNFFYDRLAGHGHKLFRVVPWILGTMAAFLLWSGFAYHQGSMVPTNPRVYMHTCYLNPETPCDGWKLDPRGDRVLQIPNGYPAFHPILYTLDTFIPFADLHQEAYWTVTDRGPWGEWTRLIFSIFIGLGGVLSAIFAAAMLSLIRKT